MNLSRTNARVHITSSSQVNVLMERELGVKVSDGESVPPSEHPEDIELPQIKVYKKRWLMLILFTLVSMNNAFHWVQFAIISDVISSYYNVSDVEVNWTAMIYMVIYVFLVLPGDMITDSKGLKLTVILGIGLSTVGAWIKVASVAPDRFYVAFIAQTFEAFAQVFILGIPSRLAAVWFGENEVSTACAIGVFGNQVGIAIGFLLPPFLVPNTGTQSEITRDLLNMYYGVAIFSLVLLVFVIIFFKKEPKFPPSIARVTSLRRNEKVSYAKPLMKLLRNKPFMLLTVSYGLNAGVFYTISTLLNQLVLLHFKGRSKDAGMIGLCIVLFGMLGSLICGFILDKSKKFRETTIIVYILSFIAMLVFTFTLKIPNIIVVYCTGSLLGFFMTGYLPIGFEYGVELTFPEPESTSSAILNIASQIFGVAFIMGGGQMLDMGLDDLPVDSMLCGFLLVGVVLTICTKGTLKRQQSTFFNVGHPTTVESDNNTSVANLTENEAALPVENGNINKKS